MNQDNDKLDERPAREPSEHVYAVVRHDRSAQSPELAFTVKEIVRSQAMAEAEVNRLKEVNADKDCTYFWQTTRLFPAGTSAGKRKGERRVLAISGSVGVGKTSVLIELHDILESEKIPHGCVERDALGYSWPAEGRFNEGMVERNLSCLIPNFLEAGATYLVIAGVIETPADLEVYRRCIPNAEIQVCRLTADLDLRRERLRVREKGAGLDWHLDRTVELDGILDTVKIEDFCVDNGDRPLREVALEVLARVGWPLAPK